MSGIKRIVVAMVLLLQVGSVYAGSKGEEYRGYVKVTKNDAGKAESALFLTQTLDGLEKYPILLKGKGKKLVKELGDNMAVVTGKIKKKKNKETGEKEKVLQVKSFSPLFLGNFTEIEVQEVGKKKNVKSAKFVTITKEVIEIQMNFKAKEAIKELKEKFAELTGEVVIDKKGKDKKKVKVLTIFEYKASEVDLVTLTKLAGIDLNAEKKEEKKEEKKDEEKEKGKEKEKEKEKK